MSKIACGSCSTSAAERWLPFALAGAVLVHHTGVQAAVTKSAALGVVAIALLALRGVSRQSGLSSPLTLWLLGCGWLLVSLSWTEHPDPLAVVPFLVAAGVAAGVSAVPLPSLRIVTARTAMAVGVVSSAIAGVAWIQGSAPHGTHGNPNWLGLVLVAALPFVVVRVREARGGERALASAASVMMIGGLVVSHSRSAWLGALVAAVVFVRGRRRWAMGAGALAVAAGVSMLGELGTAFAGRLWIWRHAWTAGWSAPLLGAGPGRFGFPFLEAQGEALRALQLDAAAVTFVNATSAHHDALHLFVEGGLLAPLALLGAVAVAAWHLRARWPAATCALVAVLVSGVGDVALQQPAVLLFVGLAFAGCRPLPARRRERFLGLVVLAALACGLPLSVQQWLAERHLERAKQAQSEQRLAHLVDATELAPAPGEAALELGLFWLERGDPARAERWLLVSSDTLANAGTYVALGTARLGTGDVRGAMAALHRALDLHPARFAAHANLAEAARRAGNLPLAEHHVAAARDLQPHHVKLREITERIRRDRIDAASR